MPSSNTISVILACYNGEDTLEKCLDSINRQNISFELVFIDDGSIDNTLSIFKKFKFKKDIYVNLITRQNKGFMHSLDEGIKNSKGSYIARIDADDIWCDNHLSLLMQEFEENRKLVLVGSSAHIINEKNEILGIYKTPEKNEEIIKFLHKDSAFIHSTVIFKREAYFNTIGYIIGDDKKALIVTDYNLWFELTKLGQCKNIPDRTVYYRVSSQSMSRTIDKYINYSARYMIMKKVNDYYKTYPVYSFFQRTKVKIRIVQHYLISKIL